MGTRRFHIATEEEIRSGLVTDVYFERTQRILEAREIHKHVVAEMFVRSLPQGWQWAVLCGVEEVTHLFEGIQGVNVYAPPEGTIFHPLEPVLTVEGEYTLFGTLEATFLGLLCQASGIATKAARCRLAAGNDRILLSFGARRMHPAIAPMIERAAYIGGCDGVSSLAAAEQLGIPPTGTMPHALILLIGDTVEAARAFHEVIEPHVKRIALIDTFGDEKFEALRVAEALGPALYGVRLDTPASRRGDLLAILREIRWELDLRGYDHVKLFVSGGVDEHLIQQVNDVCDGYGVGTAISNAPTIDFSFDIVEIEGQPIAKRGKASGAKHLVRCPTCGHSIVLPRKIAPKTCPACGSRQASLTRPLIRNGEIVAPLPHPTEIRRYVLDQLHRLTVEL